MACPHAMKKEREISVRLILAAIGKNGATKAEILAATGMHPNTFYRIVRVLRKQKLVRICGRIPRTHEITGERMPGTMFMVYGLGCEPDAPKLPWIDKSAVHAKYRANNRTLIAARQLAREGKSNMFNQLMAA